MVRKEGAEKKPTSTTKQKSQLVIDKRVTIYEFMLGLKLRSRASQDGQPAWPRGTNALFPKIVLKSPALFLPITLHL